MAQAFRKECRCSGDFWDAEWAAKKEVVGKCDCTGKRWAKESEPDQAERFVGEEFLVEIKGYNLERL
jgi:hypothetical protein